MNKNSRDILARSARCFSMNTKGGIGIFLLVFYFLLAFSQAFHGVEMATHTPQINVRRDSEYFPILEKMKIHLQKAEVSQFYSAMFDLTKTMKKNGATNAGKEDEFAVQEWLRYYQARAPLLLDEKRLFGQFTKEEYQSTLQYINIKRYNIDILRLPSIEPSAKDLKMKEADLLKLRAIYFRECIFSLLEFHTSAKRTLIKLEKRHFEPIEVLDTDDDAVFWQKLREKDAKEGLSMWYVRMFIARSKISEFEENDFIHKLVLGFPKDVSHIQFCVRKLGYASNYECSRFLERTMGRTKETEYLFSGLPSKKATDEFFLNSEKDRMRRIMLWEMNKLPPPLALKAKKFHRDALSKLDKRNLQLYEVKKVLQDFEDEIKKLTISATPASPSK